MVRSILNFRKDSNGKVQSLKIYISSYRTGSDRFDPVRAGENIASEMPDKF